MSGERIETAGELDALPVGSVVVDASGEHYFAHGLPGGVQGTLWRCIHGESWRPAVMVDEATQPLTVVYRPDRDLIAEAEARGARSALLDFAVHFEKHGGAWGRMSVVEYIRGEYLDAQTGGTHD